MCGRPNSTENILEMFEDNFCLLKRALKNFQEAITSEQIISKITSFCTSESVGFTL